MADAKVTTVIPVTNFNPATAFNIGPYYLIYGVQTSVDFGLFTADEIKNFIDTKVKTGLLSSQGKTQEELEASLQAVVDFKSTVVPGTTQASVPTDPLAFDNTGTGLKATNLNDAVKELLGMINTKK